MNDDIEFDSFHNKALFTLQFPVHIIYFALEIVIFSVTYIRRNFLKYNLKKEKKEKKKYMKKKK